MSKFKLIWENNPETPIHASSLSRTTESSLPEYGNILYQDIDELIPNGMHGDDKIKVRANSRVSMRENITRAMFFNVNRSLVSHNSMFGPRNYENITYMQDSKSFTTSVYAGEGTTNLFSNPGFENDFTDWNIAINDEDQPDGYIDPTYGEEYRAKIEISNSGYESNKSAHLYAGAFGEVEISRTFSLENMSVVSISFYYKSEGGLRCYLTSGGLFWMGNDWNQSSSSVYDLPPTDGEWKRFEIKSIYTAKILTSIQNVQLVVLSEQKGAHHYIDSFQLEEKVFCSPYTTTSRDDAFLQYNPEIISAEKGFLDVYIYIKSRKDFTVLTLDSVETSTVQALELIYNDASDLFTFRVYDANTTSYVEASIPAKIVDQIDTWSRIICSWDMNEGIKIASNFYPTIEFNNTPYQPLSTSFIDNLTICSHRRNRIANIYVDTLKINNAPKEDIQITRDLDRNIITADKDSHQVFYIAENSIVLDESMLDTQEDSFLPNTSYYTWLVDDVNNDSATIVISSSNVRPLGTKQDQNMNMFGGFKTDGDSKPVVSSIWDIATNQFTKINTQRFLVDGVDSDTYNFDIRTKPYAEENDVRSTIPIHVSNNLYGRHSSDIYNQEVQYFEVNNEGWIGIDNIKIDANTITTRNYPDNNNIVDNNLEITAFNDSKVWIHAHEVDIDSGNRDVRIDGLRVDTNILYTNESTDLHIRPTHLDNQNDLYLTSNNIYFNAFQDISFDSDRDFKISTSRDFIVSTMGVNRLDDVYIDENKIYTDDKDLNIYSSTQNVDIDSKTGVILVDDIIIKDSTIYREVGDITFETPDTINIGRPGIGVDPYQSSTVIRSDNFIVESQNIQFTNADAADFITFDDLRIRQSEIYTESATPMAINSSSNLSLFSPTILNINATSKIDIGSSTGSLTVNTTSNFNDDINASTIFFQGAETSDFAKMFAESSGSSTKLKIQISDDSDDKIILEHVAVGQTVGNSMLQVGQTDVVVSGDFVVQGNLTIQGESTILNTSTLSVEDNFVELNRGQTGSPTIDAGIEVNRGSSLPSHIRWDEANDLWQIDNGDGVWHNVIFNGYDERFSENVNIVTTEPTGFKIENDLAVGGMELLSPDSFTMSGGEGIMNIGLHMNHSAGYIKDKLQPDGITPEPGSVSAFIRFDTRSSERNISFVWEEANSSVEKTLFEVSANSTISSYGNDTHSAKIYAGTPDGFGGGIIYNGDGTSDILGDSDTVSFFRESSGVKSEVFSYSHDNPTVNFNDSFSVGDSGAFYSGNTNATGTSRVNYDGYFYATRVYNAVYNDLAEYFLSDDPVEYGKVFAINTKTGKLRRTMKKGDVHAFGVCSDTPAFVMKQEYEDKGVPIALAGSVKVWVKSKIKIGQLLMSDKDGFATSAPLFVRLFRRSAIIGKAMENNDSRRQRILMLVKNV